MISSLDAVCMKIHVCDLNIIHTRGYASQKNTRDLFGENVQLQKNIQKQIWAKGNAVSPYKPE